MSDGLPDGWAQIALDELLEPGGLFDGPFGSSLKTSDYTDAGIRVVRLENLANLRFIKDKRTFIAPSKYETLRKHTVVPGDVLVGSFVDGAVRVCLLPELETPAIAKADCFCVRPSRQLVDRRFLVFQLGAVGTRDALVSEIHGATRPRITTKQLRALEIALPPLAEQRRIVAKVEALLAQVNAARDRLARVPHILRHLRESVLETACAGFLTSPKPTDGDLPVGWRLARVGDFVRPDGIFDGARDHGTRTPVALNLRTADYTDSGVRVIRLENIGHLKFIEEKRTFISHEKYHGLKQQPILCDDILFGSFIGDQVRVCLFPRITTPSITKADCFCIRVHSKTVLPAYLVLQLATRRTYGSLTELVHGATRPRITTRQLRDISIPICSLAEQARIISIVHSFFALIESIERRLAAATARADALTQSILACAFRGELVPTEAELARAEGRAFEPAEELLARVTRERATAPTTRSRRTPPSPAPDSPPARARRRPAAPPSEPA